MCKYMCTSIHLYYLSLSMLPLSNAVLGHLSCQHCQWELCRHPVTSTGRGSLIDDLLGDPKKPWSPHVRSKSPFNPIEYQWIQTDCWLLILGVALFVKVVSLQKNPNKTTWHTWPWEREIRKKWMAQLCEIKFGSDSVRCSTQTADDKIIFLNKHLQVVLQRSKIHLRRCMARLKLQTYPPVNSAARFHWWRSPLVHT